MPDERFGEEYFPTQFRDRHGSEYTVHVTVAIASEISRSHGLTLADLAQAHNLPFHVLLDVAELGTRYSAKARNVDRGETVERFFDAIGEAGAMEAVNAAGNALLGFSLRANRDLTPEQCRAVASRLTREAGAVRESMTEALTSLLGGDGSTSGASLESPESTPAD